jgi:hypothetical protein
MRSPPEPINLVIEGTTVEIFLLLYLTINKYFYIKIYPPLAGVKYVKGLRVDQRCHRAVLGTKLDTPQTSG